LEAIEVTNLSKQFGEIKAVDNISFIVEKGGICGILGPNGSGKTTTIKSICNLIIPDDGEIKIFSNSNRKSLNRISALFEGTRNLYWKLTPRENLRYFCGIRGIGGKNIEKEINFLLDRFNLTDKKDIAVNNLSRGMQQKVAIAMTLIVKTDIILLDEPTLGLDVQSHVDIKNILEEISNELNKTILLSTHDMNLVQSICKDVVVINKGKLVANESVKKLLDMFKTRSYEIELSENISNEKIEDLLQQNNDLYFINGGTKIEVDITNFQDVYKIMEVLKNSNIPIKEIKQKDVNFERVYLNLTEEELD
jgi:ABC-2 type transport system ATP-binding protein